jgi:hypothetical protein
MGADLKIFNLKINQCHPFFFIKKKSLLTFIYSYDGKPNQPSTPQNCFWVVFSIMVEVVF